MAAYATRQAARDFARLPIVGGVAQLGERRVRNAKVGSSILLLSTNRLAGDQEGEAFRLSVADTCCAPGYCSVRLGNPGADAPTFLFIADETSLHQKLGVFENRG